MPSLPDRRAAPARTWPGSTLQIAIEELLRRLTDFELQDAPIEYHSSFNRAPLAVPTMFQKGG